MRLVFGQVRILTNRQVESVTLPWSRPGDVRTATRTPRNPKLHKESGEYNCVFLCEFVPSLPLLVKRGGGGSIEHWCANEMYYPRLLRGILKAQVVEEHRSVN